MTWRTLEKIGMNDREENLERKTFVCVRHRPEQNRVTWETPTSEAFVPLQEPVAVLASYVPHA